MADAVTLRVEISGGPDLESAIMGAFAAIQPELEGVLIEEGERIMEKSQEIVPVDQGVLKASGGYYGTEMDSGGVYVRYGYGGAASSYALVQHETPPGVFRHAEGQSWKYLEFPLMEAVATMGPRMAASLKGRLASRFSGAGDGGGEVFGGGG